MKTSFTRSFAFLSTLLLAFVAGATFTKAPVEPIPSSVITQENAAEENFDWGTFYTYFQGESYGTTDVLSGVAVINPGMEIHPPHLHAEEEYLMVMEGEGTWHLNGEEFPATAGDMLYATPWDIHGITNTGSEPLTFVFWKWNNKGVELPANPAE